MRDEAGAQALTQQRTASAEKSTAQAQGKTTKSDDYADDPYLQAARAGTGAKTLEQEFPAMKAQISEARKQGYSEADIRAYLSGRQ